ncbi:L-histidine N(alpha)-methyltransferase [Pseudonocardia spinosispora]|uniref:L-histidine N(alpha)-methyltransferase n=1 Tax=Pseudonocardia spinosispora TaxID=103441 RepID=UPI00048C1593|nr:L-histidine N(alpha)-methyltransferase [Pseudonocardia spinosispora]
MSADPSTSRIVALEDDAAFWDDRATITACLREPIPRIPPWFGYDERGSELFESITRLPTYYLTRVERGLLERHAAHMAELVGCRVAELGSGSAKKTGLLLRECAARAATTYLPVDVSREMLLSSDLALRAAIPDLTVTGLWGRYEAGLDWLGDPANRADGPLVVAFLGSNLGNTTPEERAALLNRIAGTLRPGDGFLVSVDLLKPAADFETCYNDPPGHSAFADFRLNHLAHLNRRFDADFDLAGFVPRAHYNSGRTVVEGHLYATREHTVRIPGLDMTLRFRAGDSINVGFSAKFEPDHFVADLSGRGLTRQEHWIDDEQAYGLFLFRRD